MNYIVKYYGNNPRVACNGNIMSDDFDKYRRISLNGVKYEIENVYHPTSTYRYNDETKKLDKVYIVRYEIWKADDAYCEVVGDKPVCEGRIN